VLAFAAYLALRAREPSAGGKTLSQWLHNDEPDFVWIPTDLYGHIPEELWDQLIQASPNFDRATFLTNRWSSSCGLAMREMGTNAIPWLLQWMEERDTKLDHWIAITGPRLPPALRASWPASYGFGWGSRACRWQIAAFDGFSLLGTNGISALPELRRQLKGGHGGLPLTWAIASLGPKGIEVLAEALGWTNITAWEYRPPVALALGLEGAAARSALPALIDCVEHREAGYHILGAIGRIDPRAPGLAPVLIRLLDGTNSRSSPTNMVLLLLGLQGEASVAALPMLGRMYTVARSGADAPQCRLLRRVIRNISMTAEWELPPATADELRDDWP